VWGKENPVKIRNKKVELKQIVKRKPKEQGGQIIQEPIVSKVRVK